MVCYVQYCNDGMMDGLLCPRASILSSDPPASPKEKMAAFSSFSYGYQLLREAVSNKHHQIILVPSTAGPPKQVDKSVQLKAGGSGDAFPALQHSVGSR